MKKIILSIALACVLSTTAMAQGQFFGIDTNKFISLVTQAEKMPRDNAILIIDQTMKVMAENPKGYRKALDLAINRLGSTRDSIHNEDLLITVLKHATSADVLSSNEKLRPQALLESALKNCAGTVATDIDYITMTGNTENLLNNDNKFTLVFFNDPDCESCAALKQRLDQSEVLKQAVESGAMRVVAINPMNNEKLWKKTNMPSWIVNGWNKSQSINDGGSYDLPTLPVFYVLGRDNTVLLKNVASFKRIEKVTTILTQNPDTPSNTLVDLLFVR